ncbi:facilitated trehalose transporter Tret1-like [Ischnura elegans]|uniref:facilitated trehalose transporter Tret1-like n=1 Tax=Ischnura elegans TaxID=197161 RepID=UPI001ED8AE79|nr:facilitated trehalose transporter Tret1-like [Ischnura elegans]XP_046383721.1 facilitated trehalose transporter Tret1-like [Ischnura elegans]XP_046383722.1 facilitated trehalose transporter Tret1-like [Ischnura elegans]
MATRLMAGMNDHEAGKVPNTEPGKKMPQFLAAGAATLVALSGGCALAWTSPAIDLLKSPGSQCPVSDFEGSWVGALLPLGAIFGALPSGSLADRVGRKMLLLFMAVPFVISWLMLALAKSVGVLYAARFISGLVTGASCVVAPMYIAEIAEDSVRGTLSALFQLLTTMGILVVYLLGLAENYVALSWTCFTFPIVFCAAFFWMPETPKCLLGKGKREEARKSLAWLRGRQDVGSELANIQALVEEEAAASKNTSWRDIIASRANRKAFVICLGIMVFQQLSGVNAVIFYTGTIFQAAGSGLPPTVSPVIVGVVQTVFTTVAAGLVDRAGRRVLLILSSVVMSICLAALGAYFKIRGPGLEPSDAAKAIGWLPLVSLAVFIIVFSLGFGPIPWALIGEFFAPNVKGIASGVAVGTNWVLAFIVTLTFASLQESIGSDATFWMFAGFNAAAASFVIFFLPETKGKSLEQIQKELAGNVK